MKRKIFLKQWFVVAISIIAFYGLLVGDNKNSSVVSTDTVLLDNTNATSEEKTEKFPEYNGTPYVKINNNIPEFNSSEIQREPMNSLSSLDELGRCGVATACLGPETITNEERGSIGHIRPSGWHTVKYPDVIPDRYLYNRCHLLMYKASGILDDERNLITGTRYLNTEMLSFETSLVSYIEESGNHVMYRVTPVFKGNNLVASGVKMEAYSVEDNGEGLSFNVYCYNVQPGIDIDYATGNSYLH